MKFIKNIIIALIVFMPISVYYKSPVIFNQLTVLLYTIAILLSFIVILAENRKMLHIGYLRQYIFFLLWFISISLIYIVIMPYIDDSSIQNLNILVASVIVSLLVILVNTGIVDYRTLIKYYTITAYFSLFFLLIQIVLYTFFKIPISGKIPFLELISYGFEGQFNYLLYHSFKYNYVRYSSIFAEPSHLALYAIPLLCLKLFDPKKKKNYEVIFITAMILISSSGNGIVIVAILWFYYFYSRTGKISVRKVSNIIIGALVLLGIHLLLKNFTFYSTVIENLFTSSSASTKADYRIYRGFDYFLKIPLTYKLFGIGFRNLTSFTHYYGITSGYDILRSQNFEYMNAISQILIYSGLVGFSIFVSFMVKIYRISSKPAKAIVVSFVLMCFSSSVLFDTYWLLYLSMIFAINSITQEELLLNADDQ